MLIFMIIAVNRRQTEQGTLYPTHAPWEAATDERREEMQLFLKIMGKILYNKIIVF